MRPTNVMCNPEVRIARWTGWLLCGWLLCLLATGCAASPPPEPADQQTLHFSRVVDLSHIITQDMPHRPDAPATRLLRSAEDGRLEALHLSVESGTYVRLPATAEQSPSAIDLRSPRQLVVPAVVLDVRTEADTQPGYRLRVAELAAWERQHGPIPAGSLVLVATGHDKRWGDPPAYLNQSAQVALEPEAADLLRERNIQGIGIDMPGIAGNDSNWWLLGNLTNVEQLPPAGATLMIGALRVQAGTTIPARVLALVP